MIGGAFADLWTRTGRGDFANKLRRLARLPRADWGKAVAHMGLGVTILGVAGILAWETEDIRVADIGDRYQVGAYEVSLDDIRQVRGPNYVATLAEIGITRSTSRFVLTPEKRFYPVAQMPTTEASIRNGVLRDVYAVIGDPQESGGYAVRLYIKPLANWIWGGCILMALGGLLSLTDRRLRVAGGASKAKVVPAE